MFFHVQRPSPLIKDTKVCGEAATQPSLRLPPLREGRHAKLLMAAVGLRYDKESGLPPGDGVIILDGGREGSSSTWSEVWIKQFAFLKFESKHVRIIKDFFQLRLGAIIAGSSEAICDWNHDKSQNNQILDVGWKSYQAEQKPE